MSLSFHSKSVCALLLCLTLIHPPAGTGQNRVVAYYPMWTRSALPPQAIRFDLLTHILHAFAWPDTSGNLAFHEASVDTELINFTHRAGRKILLSFGGAGDVQTANLALVTADTAKRHAFINNIVAHLTKYNYDGADFDWEWPQTAAERNNEAALMRELRAAFNTANASLLISMSVGVTDYQGQWHDFATLKTYVDWFNAMAFNFHGSWSTHAGHNAPLYAPATDHDGCVNDGIVYLHNTRGIPTQQITLGLAFFGRRFQAAALYGPKTEPTADIVYTDAATDLANNWLYTWDSVSQVPYLQDRAGKYLDTFDDSTSLTAKCDYARSHQLAGVMIWTLGQDYSQGREPLLEAVSRAVNAPTSDVGPTESMPPQGYVLLQNYPNPFNPKTSIRFSVPTMTGRDGQAPGISDVKLVVYDLLGREVATLVNERKAAGSYEVPFDGTDLSSGVYIYRLSAGSSVQSKTMILLK